MHAKKCISHWFSSFGHHLHLKIVYITSQSIEITLTLYKLIKTADFYLQAMDGFYEQVKSPGNRGAIFFAVCRGKVSKIASTLKGFLDGSPPETVMSLNTFSRKQVRFGALASA